MDRRQFLAGAAALIPLAGCVEEEGNVDSTVSPTTTGDQSPTTTEEASTTTEPDPAEEYDYLISSLEDLRLMEKYRSVKFGLMEDIDASETKDWNDGRGFKPIEGDFNGVLDGRGHTISGLTINRTKLGEELLGSRIALFEHADVDSVIKNLALEKVDIIGGKDVGSIAALNDGLIINSYSTGKVKVVDKEEYEYDRYGKTVGGLVGRSSGSIIDSHSTANVIGTEEVGGLVGRNAGEIKDSYYEGDVVGNRSVGGLIGDNGSNDVMSSYSKGSVKGDENVGGLIGGNGSKARYCYSQASVEGKTRVGGLFGAGGGVIRSCYSTGKVIGETAVGGLIGSTRRDGGRSSFWDVDTSGQSTSGGNAERGKPTKLMQSIETYPDDYWGIVLKENFEDEIWYIDDGEDYPRLGFQHPSNN